MTTRPWSRTSRATPSSLTSHRLKPKWSSKQWLSHKKRPLPRYRLLERQHRFQNPPQKLSQKPLLPRLPLDRQLRRRLASGSVASSSLKKSLSCLRLKRPNRRRATPEMVEIVIVIDLKTRTIVIAIRAIRTAIASRILREPKYAPTSKNPKRLKSRSQSPWRNPKRKQTTSRALMLSHVALPCVVRAETPKAVA